MFLSKLYFLYRNLPINSNQLYIDVDIDITTLEQDEGQEKEKERERRTTDFFKTKIMINEIL